MSLYADDPAADDLRPTQDVDLAVSLLTYGEWGRLVEQLAERGFKEDPRGHIGSFVYEGISVDIMPDHAQALGVTNCWYAPAMQCLRYLTLTSGPTIPLFAPPYFLATKLEAFEQRGAGDYRASPDFEDIMFVLDNRIGIVEELSLADEAVRQFVATAMRAFLNQPHADSYIIGHLHPLIADARFPSLKDKLVQITRL
jgi:predicted nucleotidyltransferase